MTLDKYTKLRIDSWCRKISQVINNHEWKKNRNLHAICLLDMLINKRIEEPYSRLPPEGPLPILSKTLIKSKLSPKFWKQTKNIYETNSFPSQQISPIKSNENLYKNNKNITYSKMTKNMNINMREKNKNINIKKKRAKTPTLKNTNLKNINNSNVQININNKNEINMNYNKQFRNYNNKNIRNNSSKNVRNNNIKKIKNNNIKNMNNNFKNNYDFGNINSNIRNYNCYNNFQKDNNLSDFENNSNDELCFLKETVLKLEEELNKKEMIIAKQRDERVMLTQRIDELEKIFESIFSKNKL
jgi:hypothetical protein